MLNRLASKLTLFTVAALGFCLAAAAQTGPTAAPQQAPQTAPQLKEVLPSYEGQNVTTVELAGQPNLDMAALQPLLAIHPGDKFSQAKVDESVAALQHAGRFQAVELELRPDEKGVRVLLVLQPAVYFGVYEFPGAVKRFAYSRLIQVSDYPPRGAYTPVDVERASEALVAFYQQNGYFEAKVKPAISVDKRYGLANVSFHTTLGPHAKFGQVDLKGTTPQEEQKLLGALHSFWSWLKGNDIRAGKQYKYKTLQDATLYLQDQLMKQGYLGGQVKLLGANYDPQTKRADVDFQVNTGPLVHVRIVGGHVWSWSKKKLLPVYQQVGLDPELVQEGRQNLQSYFQSKGYFDAKVTTKTDKQPNGETIVYQITKGPRHKVGEVSLAGNQHLSGKELMGHVTVEEGHLFGHGKFSDKLVRQSVKNLTAFYEANGYSSVQVTPQVSNKNGKLAVTFRINEGPQDTVASLKLNGTTIPVQQLAPKGLKLKQGSGYSTKLVDEDRNQIGARLLELGYLNSTVRETAQPLANDKHKLDVTYDIYQGPQVHTASVVMLGHKDTRPTLIRREAQIPVGKPLREDSMLTSENKLYNLGIFDWAEIDPRRQITTQTQEDVVVKVHEAKKNTITYGGGFEVINRGGSVPSGTVALPGLPPVGLPKTFKTSQKTFWGPMGTFEYTRNNFRGKAETISIGGFGGRLDQRGNFTYMDPHFRSTDWQSNLTLTGEHNSQNPIFTSRMAQLETQLQHALNPDKTTNIFLRYTLRETGLTRLLIPDLVPTSDRHVRLSTVSGTYLRDTRDNVLDAHKGLYESFELGVTPSVLGSSVTFARFMGQAAYYKDVFHGIVWANSIRLGLEQPFAGSHVPLSEKFFSGGGSTLRGFPLNGAGPQRTIPACGDPADPSSCAFIRVPTGGNQLFILNSELRIPIPYDFPLIGKKLGLALFYDGGNVYPRVGFHEFAALYSNTVGAGLRYATPLGPVRIDFGHNLNGLPGIKANQFFFTIGQAF